MRHAYLGVAFGLGCRLRHSGLRHNSTTNHGVGDRGRTSKDGHRVNHIGGGAGPHWGYCCLYVSKDNRNKSLCHRRHSQSLYTQKQLRSAAMKSAGSASHQLYGVPGRIQAEQGNNQHLDSSFEQQLEMDHKAISLAAY